MRYALLSVVFSLIFFLGKAEAQAKSVFCNLCNSDWSYQQIAQGVIEHGTSEIYIINPALKEVKKFLVNNDEEIGSPTFAYETSVPVSIEMAFNDYFSSLSEFTNLSSNLNFPEDLATSAYQLVGRSYLIEDFLDRFARENFATVDRLVATAVVLLKIVKLDLNAIQTIHFKNGDRMTIRLTGAKEIVKGKIIFTFVVVSLIDVDNNPVSLVPASYSYGERRFLKGGELSLEEFLKAAARMGIPINNNSGFSPRVIITDCVQGKPELGKCVEPAPSTSMY